MHEMRARRVVEEILPTRPTIEGAGVHLRRAFGYHQVPRLDPFLLLDDFRSENPLEYVAGFPWHPHRGIETVTYMLDGRVDHQDSMGNAGIVGPGDVQWMTAGSGIIHQEMPKPIKGDRMGGFQLWVNLPASQKMMAPRYQEVKQARIPLVDVARGVKAGVISGEAGGVKGPVKDLVVDPQYLDVRMAPGTRFEHPIKPGHRAFAYLVEGKGTFDEKEGAIDAQNLVLLRDGDHVAVETGSQPARFLLVAGKPLGEPVAWWGPIVMNHQRELETAISEFREGTFIKGKRAVVAEKA